MVEKFDNSRVRFKRPGSARLKDAGLAPDIDPYRVYYGMSPTHYATLIIMLSLGISLAVMIAVFLIVRALP